MNPVKPDNRDLQRQVTELRERVAKLETEARPRQISMNLRITLVLLVFALLCGFAYFLFRSSVYMIKP